MENNIMLINCKQQNSYCFVKRESREGKKAAASWICDAHVLCSDSLDTGFRRGEPTRGKLTQSYKIILGWWDASIPSLVDYSLESHIKGFDFTQPTSSPTLSLFKDKKLLESLPLPELEEFDELCLEKRKFERWGSETLNGNEIML